MNERQLQGAGLVLLGVVVAALVAGIAWRSAAAAPDGSAIPPSAVVEGAADDPGVELVVQRGWRAEQIAQALEELGVAEGDAFLALVHDPSRVAFLDRDWAGLTSLEGYFPPGSYEFEQGIPPEAILAAFLDAFERQFPADELRQRASGIGLSVHEVVTLASIVEREMVSVSEAPVIAGVFHNRLKRGIRLQSDATVHYAVDTEYGPSNQGFWGRELRGGDLRFPSPYNTYLTPRLPPGPIASPSTEAIEAVLSPAQFDYLFFVSKGNGFHVFARTLEEHEANVERWSEGPESTDASAQLQLLVERLMAPLDGHVGVVVKNLATGEGAALGAGEFFTSASLYKLGVMWTAFQQREDGTLDYDERLDIPSTVAELDIPEIRARLGANPTVREAVEQMVVASSNAAGVALLERLGRANVERTLRHEGIAATSLVSSQLVTTPRDVARLLELVATGNAVSERASAEMNDLLLRQEIADLLPTYLPKRSGIALAHKTGTLDSLRHDAGILYSPHGPVVIVALTEDVADTDAASEAIARLGRLVYDYYESYEPSAERLASNEAEACAEEPGEAASDGPLVGRSIVLDPGHGGRDPGAIASFPDGATLEEKAITLDVALALQRTLVEHGASVVLTRCRDRFLTQTERAAIANNAHPDIVISLHVNSADDPDTDRTEVYYYGAGRELAHALLGNYAEPALWDTLSADEPLADGGTRERDFDLLVFSIPPAALTEAAHLSNPTEAQLLLPRASVPGSRRAAIVDGHLRGILGYFDADGAAGRDSPGEKAPLAPPDTQLVTNLISRMEGVDDLVALTFDDCDEPTAWSRILDILREKGVHATFFCSGTSAAAEPELAARTVAEGHSIGSHGWDHARQTELARPELRVRFEKDAAIWVELAGVSSTPYFRPPYGAYDARTLSEAARSGYSRTILWDVDSLDWTEPAAAKIVAQVEGQATAGSIVLFHTLDGTADVLRSIIDRLRARGLEPTDVPELIRAGT